MFSVPFIFWFAEVGPRMPDGANYLQLYGVALLCGIGFTMSLFIGGLAWEHANFDAPVRFGVITGSILSAVIGFLVLSFAAVANPRAQPAPESPMGERDE